MNRALWGNVDGCSTRQDDINAAVRETRGPKEEEKLIYWI